MVSPSNDNGPNKGLNQPGLPNLLGKDWVTKEHVLANVDAKHSEKVQKAIRSLQGNEALNRDWTINENVRLFSPEFLKFLVNNLSLDAPDPSLLSRADLAKEIGCPLSEIALAMRRTIIKCKEGAILCVNPQGLPESYYTKPYLNELKNQLADRKEEKSDESGAKKGSEPREHFESLTFVEKFLHMRRADVLMLAQAIGKQKRFEVQGEAGQELISHKLFDAVKDHVREVENSLRTQGRATIRRVAVAAECDYPQAYKRSSSMMANQGGLGKYTDKYGVDWFHLPEKDATSASEVIKASR